jgi:hypothetical protein
MAAGDDSTHPNKKTGPALAGPVCGMSRTASVYETELIGLQIVGIAAQAGNAASHGCRVTAFIQFHRLQCNNIFHC